MRHWDTEHEGHRIRVENEALAERLIIDGTIHDAGKGLATHRSLHGEIRTASGSAVPVQAELNEGTDEGVACRIFVAGRLVFASANARQV